MGINVQLKGESGEVLSEVVDADMVLARAANHRLSNTRLLRYLMPWSDAVFSQAQANDLTSDIAKVKSDCPDTPLSTLLSEIEPLVERLATESHLYLWFVGD
jgi:hypothetical protein